jgi:hypothetical protein
MGLLACGKCHNLAYRAQQIRAFKKPDKSKRENVKKEVHERGLA